MYLQGSQDSRQLDLDAESKFNLSSLFLMNNAANSLTEEISNLISPEKGSLFLLAGPGNNGNDTILTAKNLHSNGYSVVLFFYPEIVNSGKFAYFRDHLPFPAYSLDSLSSFETLYNQYHPCLLVDGLYGVGLSKPLPDLLCSLFTYLNQLNPRPMVLAVDIPSGISADTGQILGGSLKADITVTFDTLKNGHLLYPGKDYSGSVKVVKIGFPDLLLREHSHGFTFSDEHDFLHHGFPHFPRRTAFSHKGLYGKAGIWGGSQNYPGALALSTESCLRIGTGIVYGFFSEVHRAIIDPLLMREVIRIPVQPQELIADSSLSDWIKKLQVLAFGPGLGRDSIGEKIASFLFQYTNVPLIVDADGLYFIKPFLSNYHGKQLTLTPHLGEMSHLSDLPIQLIQENLVGTAIEYAQKWHTILVLKSSTTVVASPDGQYYIHSLSQSSLAKGGSGDLLTGLICGLQAQHADPFWAAVMGVYLHGLIAEKASSQKSSWAVLPSDMLLQLEQVLVNMEKS